MPSSSFEFDKVRLSGVLSHSAVHLDILVVPRRHELCCRAASQARHMLAQKLE